MTICAVHGCTNNTNYNKSHVSFHTFPSEKEQERRRAWIHNCRLRSVPKDASVKLYLCSTHFEKKFIVRDLQAELLPHNPTARRRKQRLTSDAVPTLFSNKKQIKIRTSSEKRIAQKEHKELIQELLKSPESRTHLPGPCTPCPANITNDIKEDPDDNKQTITGVAPGFVVYLTSEMDVKDEKNSIILQTEVKVKREVKSTEQDACGGTDVLEEKNSDVKVEEDSEHEMPATEECREDETAEMADRAAGQEARTSCTAALTDDRVQCWLEPEIADINYKVVDGVKCINIEPR